MWSYGVAEWARAHEMGSAQGSNFKISLILTAREYLSQISMRCFYTNQDALPVQFVAQAFVRCFSLQILTVAQLLWIPDDALHCFRGPTKIYTNAHAALRPMNSSPPPPQNSETPVHSSFHGFYKDSVTKNFFHQSCTNSTTFLYSQTCLQRLSSFFWGVRRVYW